MDNKRKQIAFDLDTKALKEYYPTNSWNNAYKDIEKHMLKNGFFRIQGSTYESNDRLSYRKTSNIIESLVKQNPWLNLCMRDCRQTNIGKSHSQNLLFDKTLELPKREEIIEQKQKFSLSAVSAKEKEIKKQKSVADKAAQIKTYEER